MADKKGATLWYIECLDGSTCITGKDYKNYRVTFETTDHKLLKEVVEFIKKVVDRENEKTKG